MSKHERILLFFSDSGTYVVTLVGLTNGEARQGDTISVSISPAITTETVTYQWTQDGADIPGATTDAETVAIGTDHTDGAPLRCVVTIDGEPFQSNDAPMRYAPGALAVADQSAWTVDDTSVSLDASASGANLTFSNYQLFGLPHLSINGTTGEITGTISFSEFNELSANTGAVLVEDQYGRTLYDEFAWSAALRAQATAANNLSDQTFTVGEAVDLDLTGDFTLNGNTPTYAITGLPSGLMDDGDGSISGTPTVVDQAGSIVITATDEYGRQVTSAFSYTTQSETLAVTDEGDGTLAVTWDGILDSLTVGGGGAFDNTYTQFHDGTALDEAHLAGVAGRALTILDTTGNGEVGQTLTAGAYLVLHGQAAEPTVTIQWQRDGVDISGATGSTYTLVSADAGADVRPAFVIASAGLTDVIEAGSAISVATGGPDLWAFTGSTATNVPASSTWVFTGSVVTTVGDN